MFLLSSYCFCSYYLLTFIWIPCFSFFLPFKSPCLPTETKTFMIFKIKDRNSSF
uniref:Uncharacterized protein n=1 Tax=Rhizophora mucronata TaxID=61149 RepID=A0A2P2J3W4_RHIMU